MQTYFVVGWLVAWCLIKISKSKKAEGMCQHKNSEMKSHKVVERMGIYVASTSFFALNEKSFVHTHTKN
jgi:hypothetical protein